MVSIESQQPSVSINKDKELSLFVNNVDDPSKLSFECPGIDYKLFSTENPRVFSFEFEKHPQMNNKSIKVYHSGKLLEGTPIILKSKLPSFQHNEAESTITFSNVADPNKIELESDRQLNYDIYMDETDAQKFHLRYSNPGNIKTNFNLTYDSEKLNQSPIAIGTKTPLKPGTLIFSSKNTNVPEQTIMGEDQGMEEYQDIQDYDSNPNNREEDLRMFTKADVGNYVHPVYGKLVHVHDGNTAPAPVPSHNLITSSRAPSRAPIRSNSSRVTTMNI